MVVKSLADLFLDSPVYNAHGTAADILWAGVPLVTLPQTKMAARYLASLSLALTLPCLSSTSTSSLSPALSRTRCCPQLTLMAARVALSMVTAVGCPEMSTSSFEEYEQLAYTLATTPPLLEALRLKLNRNVVSSDILGHDGGGSGGSSSSSAGGSWSNRAGSGSVAAHSTARGKRADRAPLFVMAKWIRQFEHSMQRL